MEGHESSVFRCGPKQLCMPAHEDMAKRIAYRSKSHRLSLSDNQAQLLNKKQDQSVSFRGRTCNLTPGAR